MGLGWRRRWRGRRCGGRCHAAFEFIRRHGACGAKFGRSKGEGEHLRGCTGSSLALDASVLYVYKHVCCVDEPALLSLGYT